MKIKWPVKVDITRLDLGEIVWQKKAVPGGFVWHSAIIVRNGPGGLIAHNSKTAGGVRLERFDQFVYSGGAVYYDCVERDYDRIDAVLRAMKLIESGRYRNYSLFARNCQHFVSDAVYGRAFSEELGEAVGAVATGALIGSLIAMLFKGAGGGSTA